MHFLSPLPLPLKGDSSCATGADLHSLLRIATTAGSHSKVPRRYARLVIALNDDK